MAEDTTHRLADGTRIHTRPLRPDDREKLRNGFARMSPESKYRRFFSAPSSLSESTLDYLTRTDGWHHVAIGAELGDDGADTSYGIGIARFVRLPENPAKAEAAEELVVPAAVEPDSNPVPAPDSQPEAVSEPSGWAIAPEPSTPSTPIPEPASTQPAVTVQPEPAINRRLQLRASADTSSCTSDTSPAAVPASNPPLPADRRRSAGR
jgi:hypothetical protein